jgi:hypothetical protein
VHRADGKSVQVNRQLQVLKCAELALLAIDPYWHKQLRKVYDRLGKPLARGIQNPYLADLAYLLLKPCEWLTGLLLNIVVPEHRLISKKFFTE